jgi:hypothetical protein
MDAGACTGNWIPKRANARKQLKFCEIPDDTGAGAGCDGSIVNELDMFELDTLELDTLELDTLEPDAPEPEAFDHVVLNR